MKAEQIKQEIKSKYEEFNKLKEEIFLLKKRLLETSVFKYGQQVEYYKKIYFICSVKLSFGFNNEYYVGALEWWKLNKHIIIELVERDK